MGKTDALLKEMGSNLAESIGVRSGPVREFSTPPKAEIGKASPKDGYTRDRSAGEMLLANIIPDPTNRERSLTQRQSSD